MFYLRPMFGDSATFYGDFPSEMINAFLRSWQIHTQILKIFIIGTLTIYLGSI